MSRFFLFLALIFGCFQPANAQDLSALARVNQLQSELHDDGQNVILALSLSRKRQRNPLYRALSSGFNLIFKAAFVA